MLRLAYPVVLASASPRRKELLAWLIEDFEILVSDVPEHAEQDPAETATVLAELKAKNPEIIAAVRDDMEIKPETDKKLKAFLGAFAASFV